MHPALEQLVDEQESTEVQRHQASCPRCRVELALYLDSEAPAAPLANAPRRGGVLAALAGLPFVFGVLLLLFGQPSELLMMGPWWVLVLLLSAAAIGHAVRRSHHQRAGEELGLFGWLALPAALVGAGYLGSGIGSAAVLKVLPQIEPARRASMAGLGVEVATSVEWASWPLASLLLLFVAQGLLYPA